MHEIARPLLLALVLIPLAGCGGDSESAGGAVERPPAPVGAAPIETRPITLRRTFSGALEASAEVLVAPRIAGLMQRLHFDIGDRVENGQVVAEIDDAEWRQATLQADAELSVARANHVEAESANEIAKRALDRAEALHRDGVTSQAELDNARTTALARSSRIAVTKAQIERAEAALETAQLRLSDTRIEARWSEIPSDGAADDALATGPRLVAQRFLDEGALVSAGQSIITLVDLDPVIAVVFVPERDYAGLAIGQIASLTTDAYPGQQFTGRVARIAPVFNRATRQVRVELSVENGDLILKPGMFIRATLELDARAAATVVPYVALTKRGQEVGVFVLDDDDRARWRPVTAGIREGTLVELVSNEELTGRVVTLGQELLDDGSPVLVTDEAPL